ncbi:K-box domain-containing protein [Heracleum sosnowskyi]|uniref:K-box domain-containing protein n=1 Tax=Heracleum sosnowskyi TaxID=360622 RepID=A0AAD8IFJ3_9APIA|nr:K-box domain-containing protein [Heracleum sosnowskyi]
MDKPRATVSNLASWHFAIGWSFHRRTDEIERRKLRNLLLQVDQEIFLSLIKFPLLDQVNLHIFWFHSIIGNVLVYVTLYEFSSSSSINGTIERYQKICNNLETGKSLAVEETKQHEMEEMVATMTEKIKQLEECQEKLLGVGLEAYTVDELQELEKDLDLSLKNIRARKDQLLKQQIDQLKEEERELTKRNAELKKLELQALENKLRDVEDVEIGLFLGPTPERRMSH